MWLTCNLLVGEGWEWEKEDDHYFWHLVLSNGSLLCLILLVRLSICLTHSRTQIISAVNNKHMCSPSLTYYQDCLKPWERQGDGYFSNRLGGWSSIWKYLHNNDIYSYATGTFDFKDYRLFQRCPKHTLTYHMVWYLPPFAHVVPFTWIAPNHTNLDLLENSLLSYKTLHQPFILWLYSRPFLSHINSHSLSLATSELKHLLLGTSIAHAFCTFFLLLHVPHCILMICLQIYLHPSL